MPDEHELLSRQIAHIDHLLAIGWNIIPEEMRRQAVERREDLMERWCELEGIIIVKPLNKVAHYG
jgi:FMN-dependent NADH-azoreductase